MSLAFAHKTNRAAPNPAQIQKMLDENGHLIQTIQDYQSRGRAEDCVHYQHLLHRNLVFIASIVDSNDNPSLCDPETKTEQSDQKPHLIFQQQSRTEQNGASESLCSYSNVVGQDQQPLSDQIPQLHPACNSQNPQNAYISSQLPAATTGLHNYEDDHSNPAYGSVGNLPNQSSYSNSIVYLSNQEPNYNSSTSENYGQFTT